MDRALKDSRAAEQDPEIVGAAIALRAWLLGKDLKKPAASPPEGF